MLFGKAKKQRSANDQYIMDAGKSVGNLKSAKPKPAPPKTIMANKTAMNKKPMPAAAQMTVSRRTKLGALGNVMK